MGIPYFFREIVRSNKNVIKSIPPSCHRLYLDFNSIIHVASQHVASSQKEWKSIEELEQSIFEGIIQHTMYVVKNCPPGQLLYIGIDGVAPLAKMVQQRKRRHLSALQNSLIHQFKEANNIPFTPTFLWDSNCITPGTPFMYRLKEYLQTYFANTELPYAVIISGADEEGEGEHKIMKYIKDFGNRDKFVDVIYGLDADLIMLSLTCQKDNIYLMRENSQIGGHLSDNTFRYLTIDVLRNAVAIYLYGSEDNRFMMDYVCICFILGNDFLPHTIAYDIKNNGLHAICDAYRSVYAKHSMFMIEINPDGRYTMNHKMLETFFDILSNSEETKIKDIISRHYDRGDPVVYSGKTPLDRFMFDLNYMPSIKKKKAIDPELDPFWKASYYNMFFQLKPQNIQGLDNVCKSYLEGIEWNMNYYLNGDFNHNWFYKYNAAPFIKDISAFLKKQDAQTAKTIQTQKHSSRTQLSISPLEQLLIVLPEKSHHLFPVTIQQKIKDIENGMVHLYPSIFQVITFLKTQLWECPPILPPIDIKCVKHFSSMNQ